MSVITIEGRLGAGGPDLGRMVAKELGLDFVDRLMLADIAKRVGATVTALADQESRVPSLANRFAQAIQRMLHRSAVAGMGGDPYFGPGIEQLLDHRVKIPMGGRVGSLNVSAAAAVMLFELQRRSRLATSR